MHFEKSKKKWHVNLINLAIQNSKEIVSNDTNESK
jgi:hypothetical protein